MSYTKHTWVDGEVITQQKLNHIEEGIEETQTDYATISYVDSLVGEISNILQTLVTV